MKKRELFEKQALIPFILQMFALALGIGALLVPLATGLKTSVSSDTTTVITNYGPAFSFFFGGAISTGRIQYASNGVTVIGMIGYIFLILACLGLIGRIFIKKNNVAKILVLSSVILFSISSILMLCAHDSAATVLADSILGRHSDSVTATMIRTSTTQFGFWGVSLFGFISAVSLLASFIFDGTIDEIRARIIQ